MISVLQVSYICICTLAILGNTLTIAMFALERELLKKSYNMLILVLATNDVLIAVNVIVNPSYVMRNWFPYPTNPFIGEIFCRFIYNRVLIFQLIFFSVYITLVLTAERWFAVVRPHQHNQAFSRKKVLGYVILSWAWSFLLMVKGMIDYAFNPNGDKICQIHDSIGPVFKVAWYTTQTCLKMVVPCLAMIALYIHMILKTVNSPTASAERKAKLKGKMTRLVAATSIFLIVLYVPNQIVFLLSTTGKVVLGSSLHQFTSFLTFTTTCINPFIYGLSNKNYQQRYWRILSAIFPKVIKGRRARVDVEAVNTVRIRGLFSGHLRNTSRSCVNAANEQSQDRLRAS